MLYRSGVPEYAMLSRFASSENCNYPEFWDYSIYPVSDIELGHSPDCFLSGTG